MPGVLHRSHSTACSDFPQLTRLSHQDGQYVSASASTAACGRNTGRRASAVAKRATKNELTQPGHVSQELGIELGQVAKRLAELLQPPLGTVLHQRLLRR